MSKLKFATVAVALSGHLAMGWAYETSTHSMLTKIAVVRSKLATDASLLQDLGFPAHDVAGYVMTPGAKPAVARTVVDVIAAGAVWEDDQYKTRVFNHFFDVQWANNTGRGLFFLGHLLGQTSPDWILEDLGTVSDMFGRAQEFSFMKAQQQFYNSLVGVEPSTRFVAFSNALQMLGHITHHIQDMAQPQHVRNDQHVHPFLGTNPEWSFYEGWTESTPEAAKAAALPYPEVVFPTAREFWYTPQWSDDRTQYFRGMAEFTAKNFVSFGTEYETSVFDLAISGAPDLPLPTGVNRSGTLKYLRYAAPETVVLTDGEEVYGSSPYLYGEVYDGYTGQSTSGIRLAAPSLLDDFISLYHLPSLFRFIENDRVHQDALKLLLPRAVAFSAGLINHFFRGRLDLRRGSGNNWLIDNVGQQTMIGNFAIYAEDSNGKRFAVTSASHLTLAPRQTHTLTVQAPPMTQKLVVAFQGRIGAEGDATLASGYWAVAGKVVAYNDNERAVPCGVPLYAGGSSEGLSVLQELGATAGTVQVRFETYSIPDSLDITTESGRGLISTHGLVSGTQLMGFSHNPDAAGSTKVRVRVRGNDDTNTIWTLSTSCPGKESPAPPPVKVLMGEDSALISCHLGICQSACIGNWSFVSPGDFAGGLRGIRSLEQGHAYRYTLQWNQTGPNGPTGCSMPAPYYLDPSGKHPLPSGTNTLTIQQYGNGGGG